MRQVLIFLAVVGVTIMVTADDGWSRQAGFYMALGAVIGAFLAARNASGE